MINSAAHKVGLLGGSFNPPHGGHLEISLYAIERLKLDAVWWLVTPGNPLKDQSIYAPYDTRLTAAREIAGDAPIIVSDFEKQHGLQYTAETVPALIKAHPDNHFVWLMGADSLATFHRWKEWRMLANAIPMAVFNRPGASEEALKSEAATALAHHRLDEKAGDALCGSKPPAWIFFPQTENPLSSTALRQAGLKRT